MSKSEQTRDRIIEQAAILFNRQGYAGSSLSDLMAVTGLKKGGIYNHFHSKDQLALEAFDYAVNRMQQQFRGALKGKRHAVDRLIAMISIYEHMLEDPPLQGGCPLLNTAVESDDTHPALRQRTQQAMDDWRRLIRRVVIKGMSRHELRPHLDPDRVATVLISTVEGAVMLAKLYNDPLYLEQALDHLRSYIRDQLATAS